MNIQLNGQPQEVADNLTITALLESMELYGRRIAVEVNEELVTRSQFGSHQLQEGDVIEIVQAIGGG
jgi:sulfur carrier protein